MRHQPTYQTWQGMKQRCYNPRNHNYAAYGARGIAVCAEWLCYDAFLADMGERSPGMTIERIDIHKGYSPANCRWATKQEQRANQRNHNQNTHRTHCRNGHPLSGSNLKIETGFRRCATCAVAAWKIAWVRKKARAALKETL